MSTSAQPVVPRRTRIYRNHHVDSTLWDGFVPREGDIIISTPAKTGTTWTQRIVGLLVFQSATWPDTLNRVSPWMDSSFIVKVQDPRPLVESQTHRRFLKSHVPLDGLPYFPEVKYICVGRDGRDVFMSLWNHYRSYTAEAYELFDAGWPPEGHCPRCPEDIHEFWRGWISRGAFPWERDGYPFGSHFEHLRSFWEHRRLPNVLLVHYNDLKQDLAGEMRRIARYLEIEVPEAKWPELVEAASFEAMKRDGELLLPELALVFQGGAASFLHKGTNEWRGEKFSDFLAQMVLGSRRPSECFADFCSPLPGGVKLRDSIS